MSFHTPLQPWAHPNTPMGAGFSIPGFGGIGGLGDSFHGTSGGIDRQHSGGSGRAAGSPVLSSAMDPGVGVPRGSSGGKHSSGYTAAFKAPESEAAGDTNFF